MNWQGYKQCRDAFGEVLVELGEQYPNLVVLDADISSSTRTGAFAKKFPERAFNFGVAEQNMMGIAAGLATVGFMPFVCTYAVFASMRACEQFRTMIAYPRLNVKVIATHGGIEVGWDGVTHQGVEDIAIMRAIPNTTVVAPADAVATKALVKKAAKHEGPLYMRMGRNPVPIVYNESQEFEIGKGIVLREGSDVTIVAIGVMLSLALEAAERLEGQGISATVIDMHTIKPLDKDLLAKWAIRTGAIVTVEDHNIFGGLGGAVAEAVTELHPVPVIRVGLPDTFAESGAPEELFKKYGMFVDHIIKAVEKALSLKAGSEVCRGGMGNGCYDKRFGFIS